jgi:hypothetical protein
MGAHNLADRAVGKTMSEAYDRAVSYAQGEYGHNAYNGTISTTEGFNDKTEELEKLLTRKREGSVKFTVNVGNGFGFKRIDKHFKDMTEDEWHKQCVNDWEEEAWDNTDKWGEVWGAKTNKVTENSIEKNLYLFAGWAAE